MEFPRFVYKDGGPIERAGGSYDFLHVNDEDEFSQALSNGWHEGLLEAIEANRNQPTHPIVPRDDEPPTREEIEAKLTELGVRFHHKTGDAKLAEMLKKALEA